MRNRHTGGVVRKEGWLLLAALIAGCTREEYRKAADRDAYALTQKEISDPAFDVGRIRVEPDASSRLADPNSQDHPPKPPDDPAAARAMDRPGGMRGFRHWDRDGFVNWIENPDWCNNLPLDDKGRLPLTPERAMELALLNSPGYQTAVETIYTTALNVALARFAFSPQYFAGDGILFSHTGSGGLINGENTSLTSDPNWGFNLALAAGGQIMTEFANSLVWEYTGGTSQLITSNLLVNLTQPLLRNFGRDVALEPLTQAERNLLYAVRTFARFRKQFWANVTTENGYLGLLLQLQNIRNNQADLKSQEQNYRLLLELFDGGKASRVQVDQAFRSFLTARLTVAQAQSTYNIQLDAFKIQLGLPPQIPVDLDDSLLSQFQLILPALETLREDTSQFQLARFKELNNLPSAASLHESYAKMGELLKRVPPTYDRVVQELDEGFRLLDTPLKQGQDPEQRQRTRRDYTRFRKTLEEVKKELAELPERINRDGVFTEDTRKLGWDRLLLIIRDYLGHLDDLIAIQTVLRINHIALPDLEESQDADIAEALTNRLDLMNQKAQVTDAWRQIPVSANALRGDLNLTSSVNMSTVPLGFSTPTSGVTLGLQYNAPLNRFAQRNAYRTAQINYQQARRSYMTLQDTIVQSIRRDLSQLEITRLGFEIARESLISAARQVESARIQLLTAKDDTGTGTLNMLDALSGLLSARNALAQSYISYEQLRIQLLLDLERLQLDPRGFPTNERATPSTGTDGIASAPDGASSKPVVPPDAKQLPPPDPVPQTAR
jgi:outer membrane protein TolC